MSELRISKYLFSNFISKYKYIWFLDATQFLMYSCIVSLCNLANTRRSFQIEYDIQPTSN